MIDEPLALLAEAFGPNPEHPIPPPAGHEASDVPSDLTVTAVAIIDQTEITARAH